MLIANSRRPDHADCSSTVDAGARGRVGTSRRSRSIRLQLRREPLGGRRCGRSGSAQGAPNERRRCVGVVAFESRRWVQAVHPETERQRNRAVRAQRAHVGELHVLQHNRLRHESGYRGKRDPGLSGQQHGIHAGDDPEGHARRFTAVGRGRHPDAQLLRLGGQSKGRRVRRWDDCVVLPRRWPDPVSALQLRRISGRDRR